MTGKARGGTASRRRRRILEYGEQTGTGGVGICAARGIKTVVQGADLAQRVNALLFPPEFGQSHVYLASFIYSCVLKHLLPATSKLCFTRPSSRSCGWSPHGECGRTSRP